MPALVGLLMTAARRLSRALATRNGAVLATRSGNRLIWR